MTPDRGRSGYEIRRSGESTMWFNFRTWPHMWVEFVVGSRQSSSLLRGFFSGFSGFPTSTKTPIRPGTHGHL